MVAYLDQESCTPYRKGTYLVIKCCSSKNNQWKSTQVFHAFLRNFLVYKKLFGITRP